MFRSCVKCSLYCATWPFFPSKADVVSGKTPTEEKLKEEITTHSKTETGWDRVKHIFEKNEFGGLNPELSSITQVAWLSIFVGAIYGGINNSKEAYLDFIKNNQATAFSNHMDAKKKLQDKVSLSFAKGALKWSWRVSFFTTSFVGTYTIIQAYRNKCGVIEYVIAGITSGSLYKFKMGPKGWVVGAGLGGVLGLIAGGLTNLLLGLSGMTMQEARYWQNNWLHKREVYHAKKAEEHRQKEENTLLYDYSKAHADKEITLDNIDNKN